MAELALRRPILNLLCKSKNRSKGYRRYSAPTDGSIPTAKLKYVPSEGTYPKGFQAGTAHVGVKASNTKFDDLTLIVSEKPCTASAVFTRNKFQAAPVVVSREILHARQQKGIKAVIINSGCANAVTGKKGLEDARLMATETDRLLLGDSNEGKEDPRTCVMSTGVIGQKLPIEKLTSKIPNAISSLGSTHDHWLKAARAICTTDTFPKLVSTQFTLPSYPGRTFAMTGMIKGAGMIAPNMGTLLGVIATDAPISPLEIKKFLGTACNKTFNAIVIDGDTSTNDTVMLMANGAAAVDSPEETPKVMLRCDGTEDALAFQTALDGLSTSLAQLVVRDGEGATKFVTIRIKGAPRKQHAYAIANSIAKSPLVKTALYGRDANWGRILCAIGYTRPLVIDGNETVLPDEVSVSFVPRTGPEVEHGELKLLEHGEPVEVDEARASRILAEEDLEILVRLRKFSLAEEEAVVWTCDFSHEYVTINGDYRT